MVREFVHAKWMPVLCVCVHPLCLCVSTASRTLSLPAIRFEVFRLSQADSPVTTAASSFPESLEGFLHQLTLPENPHLISASQTDVTFSPFFLLSLAFISLFPSIFLNQGDKNTLFVSFFSLNHSYSPNKWKRPNLLLLYYIVYSIILENLSLSHKNAAFYQKNSAHEFQLYFSIWSSFFTWDKKHLLTREISKTAKMQEHGETIQVRFVWNFFYFLKKAQF